MLHSTVPQVILYLCILTLNKNHPAEGSFIYEKKIFKSCVKRLVSIIHAVENVIDLF